MWELELRRISYWHSVSCVVASVCPPNKMKENSNVFCANSTPQSIYHCALGQIPSISLQHGSMLHLLYTPTCAVTPVVSYPLAAVVCLANQRNKTSTLKAPRKQNLLEPVIISLIHYMSKCLWRHKGILSSGPFFIRIMKVPSKWRPTVKHLAGSVPATLIFGISSSPIIPSATALILHIVLPKICLPISSPNLYKGRSSANSVRSSWVNPITILFVMVVPRHRPRSVLEVRATKIVTCRS